MTAMKNPGSRSIVVNRRKLQQTNCSLLYFLLPSYLFNDSAAYTSGKEGKT